MQVLLGLAQVRLEYDASVRPGAKLILLQDLFADPQGKIFIAVLLHVHGDKSADLSSSAQDGP